MGYSMVSSFSLLNLSSGPEQKVAGIITYCFPLRGLIMSADYSAEILLASYEISQ
jgi:hypothetical protein